MALNDAQKSMGIITLALLSGGYIGSFDVPTYVKLLCAFAMALGTSVGGWKIIRTVGGKIFRMQPVHWVFSADLNSAIVIFGATLLTPSSFHNSCSFWFHHGCRCSTTRQSSTLGCCSSNAYSMDYDHSLFSNFKRYCLSYLASFHLMIYKDKYLKVCRSHIFSATYFIFFNSYHQKVS